MNKDSTGNEMWTGSHHIEAVSSDRHPAGLFGVSASSTDRQDAGPTIASEPLLGIPPRKGMVTYYVPFLFTPGIGAW